METTKLRILRLRHNIPLSELASAAGISVQHLSRLELGVVNPTVRQEQKVNDAMSRLICNRQTKILELERDYLSHQGNLLQVTEESEYDQ